LPHDIFFSYRRHDLERARPLLNAFAEAGVRVWHDQRDIPEQASITDEIRRGIADSRAFVAFYSRSYPESNACQQEFTIAWLAAQQMDQRANRRIWIVNPESGLDHNPELLRDQQCSPGAGANWVKQRLRELDASLLGSGVRGLPAYHGMSPIQAKRFTGRAKDLLDLHGKLTANRISIITGVYGHAAAQVRGLGGIGKSLLAREYSIRFGPAYPGGVFWLNAYGNDDTKGALAAEQREAMRQGQIVNFAVEAGISTEGRKPEEIEASFWQSIEKRAERCLWILDDLPSDLSQNEVMTWNARWAGASTLFTTRSKEYGALGSVLDLGVLSTREAFDLLCSHRRPKGTAAESAARRIVELLGCHPLAVEVAGGYLGQAFEGFEDYAEALGGPNQDAAEFGEALKESLPTGHQRSVGSTLLKSILQLDEEGRDFLRLASVLAVAPIAVSFVLEVFELLHAGGAARNRAVSAVNQVEALSLCERDADDTRTVHTLVSRTTRFRFPDDQRTMTVRATAVRALKDRLQAVAHIGEYAKIAMDIPHARHLVSGCLGTLEEISLAGWLARWDYEQADYPSARKLQEHVIEANRRLRGEEHPHTLRAINNLSQTLTMQGELDAALGLEELAVAARRRVLGEDHPDMLVAMSNLALIRHKQGRFSEAQKIEKRVLEASRRVLGLDHPGTLTVMSTLAGTLKAQGDLAGARNLDEQVVEARRRVLGEDHPDTLVAMGNLAGTLYRQRAFGAARKLQEHVLATARRVLGDGHLDTLLAINNLAQTLYANGDLEAARELQTQALEGLRRLLGEEHPDTLMAMNNLANMTTKREAR
jgi:tetratricopeptide (TPR) repeat protein